MPPGKRGPRAHIATRMVYRWQVSYDDPLMATEVFDGVVKVVKRWQQLWPKRYEQGNVTGTAFGLIEVTMVCHGNEQWQAHRFAMKLSRALAVRARVSVRQMVNPDPETTKFRNRQVRDPRTQLLASDLARMVPWPGP